MTADGRTGKIDMSKKIYDVSTETSPSPNPFSIGFVFLSLLSTFNLSSNSVQTGTRHEPVTRKQYDFIYRKLLVRLLAIELETIHVQGNLNTSHKVCKITNIRVYTLYSIP